MGTNRSLRRQLAFALAKAALLAAVFGIYAMAAGTEANEATTAAPAPLAPGSPEYVVGSHAGCYAVEDLPAGMPVAHAVLRHTLSSRVAYVGGTQAQDAADQALFSKDHGISEVYALCR